MKEGRKYILIPKALITKEMVDAAIETSLSTLAKYIDTDKKEYYWLKFRGDIPMFSTYETKTDIEAKSLAKEYEKIRDAGKNIKLK